MVSFSRTHYRISLRHFFARGAYRQEGPTGQRGLLASGGGFGPGDLPLGYAPGGTQIPQILIRAVQIVQNHALLLMTSAKLCVFNPSKGHLRSYNVSYNLAVRAKI